MNTMEALAIPMAYEQTPEQGRGGCAEECSKPIGELMVMEGVITKAQLDEALRAQVGTGGRLAERLIGLGYLNAGKFARFLAKQPGVSSIVLSNCHVSADLISLIPREFAIAREVFPVDQLGKLLTVAMVCPLDRQTIRELHELTGLSVKPMLCTKECIIAAVQRYYPVTDEYTAPILGRQEMYRLEWARG